MEPPPTPSVASLPSPSAVPGAYPPPDTFAKAAKLADGTTRRASTSASGTPAPPETPAVIDTEESLLRSAVIQVLATTANGCLSELGYTSIFPQKIKELESINTRLVAECDYLRRQLSTATTQLNQHMSALTGLNEHTALLSNQSTTLLTENTALTRRLSEAEHRLIFLDASEEGKMKKYAEMQGRIKALQAQRDECVARHGLGAGKGASMHHTIMVPPAAAPLPQLQQIHPGAIAPQVPAKQHLTGDERNRAEIVEVRAFHAMKKRKLAQLAALAPPQPPEVPRLPSGPHRMAQQGSPLTQSHLPPPQTGAPLPPPTVTSPLSTQPAQGTPPPLSISSSQRHGLGRGLVIQTGGPAHLLHPGPRTAPLIGMNHSIGSPSLAPPRSVSGPVPRRATASPAISSNAPVPAERLGSSQDTPIQIDDDQASSPVDASAVASGSGAPKAQNASAANERPFVFLSHGHIPKGLLLPLTAVSSGALQKREAQILSARGEVSDVMVVDTSPPSNAIAQVVEQVSVPAEGSSEDVVMQDADPPPTSEGVFSVDNAAPADGDDEDGEDDEGDDAPPAHTPEDVVRLIFETDPDAPMRRSCKLCKARFEGGLTQEREGVFESAAAEALAAHCETVHPPVWKQLLCL